MGDHDRMRLNDALPTPLYHQLYVVLRDRIVSGAWTAGERVPSEAELSSLFAVSRITVRRALQQLADEHLIERRRGKGTQVAAGVRPAPIVADLANILPYLEDLGRRTASQVLAFEYSVPPPEVALELQLEAGEPAQRAVRVRTLDGEPFSHLTTFVPPTIGRRFEAADLARTAMLELLDRAGHRPTRARQVITAGLADPGVAGCLDVPLGAATLTMTRVVLDQQECPIEWIRAHYRPDRFTFALDLERAWEADRLKWTSRLADAETGLSVQ